MPDKTEVALLPALAEGLGALEVDVVQIAVVDDVAVTEHPAEPPKQVPFPEFMLIVDNPVKVAPSIRLLKEKIQVLVLQPHDLLVALSTCLKDVQVLLDCGTGHTEHPADVLAPFACSVAPQDLTDLRHTDWFIGHHSELFHKVRLSNQSSSRTL